jgi:4-hydroxy-tetrahydrodipicolinate reductase
MTYGLIGYGKMGRAIERVAAARGHVCVAVVDRTARGRRMSRTLAAASWRGVKTAFEFTEPESAKAHVIELLERGVAVVCGTTGWDAADRDVRRAARASTAGCVIAANFSVGMNIFYAVVTEAGRLYRAAGYDPWIAEWHHRAKVDAPSGTARRLQSILDAGVPIAAVRAGHEPGRHLVGFDGPDDAITLEHAARGRDGFATGAWLAAEWLQGRRGLYGFDAVLDTLVSGKARRGVRR